MHESKPDKLLESDRFSARARNGCVVSASAGIPSWVIPEQRGRTVPSTQLDGGAKPASARSRVAFDPNPETPGPDSEGTTMAAARTLTDDDFVEGLRSQIGKRVRIWYEIDLSESGAGREMIEGRLTAVDAEVVLDESRLVHPSLKDDRERRTAPLQAVRGYHVLDQRTGVVARTLLRSSPQTR